MNKNIKIVDTTLRDGEQRPGIALKIKDKIQIAKALDECGVYEIEVGASGLNLEGKECYSEIKKQVQHAKISIWSRMVPDDIGKAIECNPDTIHIGVPVSYVQIYSKLNKNKVWLHKQILECMEMIGKENISVTVGFEDASRADEGFMIDTARLVKEQGGTTIRIADTVGIFTPLRTDSLIRTISEKVDIQIEFHGHNDLGMALANSIVSAKAGATLIDCTLLGIGERSGNCDMKEFAQIAGRYFDLGLHNGQIKQAEELLIDILKKRKKYTSKMEHQRAL